MLGTICIAGACLSVPINVVHAETLSSFTPTALISESKESFGSDKDTTISFGATETLDPPSKRIGSIEIIEEEFMPEKKSEEVVKEKSEKKEEPEAVDAPDEDAATPVEDTKEEPAAKQPIKEETPKPAESESVPEREPVREPAPQETAAPAEPAVVEAEPSYQSSYWNGTVLNPVNGRIQGPSGVETYYNLPMEGCVQIMRNMGNTDDYWVREDGAKMLGGYIMVAANLNTHPRGSLVETSLGTGIVVDTGTFAQRDPYQIDIAVNW